VSGDPFRPARGPILWWLRATGYGGITMPWRRAYLIPARLHDPALRAHEQVHLDQLARLGPVRFAALYLWLLIRHGYERHPMEVEARERSGSW
jgi:hypothetical protein